ncbi:aspartyl protease family protein [Hyalangium gracile]|uniref:aspartyl protease family protein n=1 Tax=Hyalangium gracile TaxID=394092 RepID=UPI001CCB334B|nr:aspartyl protease family protein [Hyalangium gracile]
MNLAALSLVLVLGAAPDTGSSSGTLAPLLAKHLAAMGGERALTQRSRMKVTQRTTRFGLAGTAVSYSDGVLRRYELRFPEVPLEFITIWDGQKQFRQGTNGDVTETGAAAIEDQRTELALDSLEYAKPGSAVKVTLLPPVEEEKQHFERISIDVPRGHPVELWLDAQGLPRRQISQSEGVTTTTFFDEYAQYSGIAWPKRVRSRSSAELKESVSETVQVEFPASHPKHLFERPTPREDATFPPGEDSIMLPLSLWQGRYVVVQAKLAGKPGNFLLDTGADSSAYDMTFVKSTGAEPKGEVAPAAGLFKGIFFVRTGELELAGMRLKPQTALAIDLHSSVGLTFPKQIHGILGYDFLSRFPFTIDYVGGWLTFWKPGSYKPAAGELTMPAEFAGPRIRLPVQVNGKDAGLFQLDTGNGGTMNIHHGPGALAALPSGGRTLLYPKGIEYGTGAAAAYFTRCDLTVGTPPNAVVARQTPVAVVKQEDPGAASIEGNGNLGYQFLRQFRLTIDYARNKLYLQQKKPFRPASTVGDFGLRVRQEKGKLRVSQLAPGFPAERAGLKVGDELVEVEGVTPEQAESEAIRLFSDAAPGEVRTVRLLREGKSVEVKLTAEALP